MRRPLAEPLQDTDYFRQVRVDPEIGTVVWPNGFDLDPDVLHGDHEPVGRPATPVSRWLAMPAVGGHPWANEIALGAYFPSARSELDTLIEMHVMPSPA